MTGGIDTSPPAESATPTIFLWRAVDSPSGRRIRAFNRSKRRHPPYPRLHQKRLSEATIAGKKVHFPERKLRTVRYDLEATYGGIYDEIVSGIESLALAPYNLESYKKKGVEVDEFEAGREQALVGIFKSRYLKRFESSVEAFRISVRRALAFLKTFESYILDGRVLRSPDFHRAMRFVAAEDEEDDATPRSLADEMDASEDAKRVLEGMESIDQAKYDLRRLHNALQHDIEGLSAIWDRVKTISPKDDVKLETLKDILRKAARPKGPDLHVTRTRRATCIHSSGSDNPGAAAFQKGLGAFRSAMDSGRMRRSAFAWSEASPQGESRARNRRYR